MVIIHENAGGRKAKFIDNDGMITANRMSEAQSKLAQASRRLSSGYRVNSAAVAGFAISEKLRAIDRGLLLIVTTNLEPQEFKTAALELKRVYSRIKAMCTCEKSPVLMVGDDLREQR